LSVRHAQAVLILCVAYVALCKQKQKPQSKATIKSIEQVIRMPYRASAVLPSTRHPVSIRALRRPWLARHITSAVLIWTKVLLVSLSHDAKPKSMRVREIQYLCFCFSDLCVSEPTLQVLNECFEEGVVSEPWMASAGVEPWMDSSTDEHFPRSTPVAERDIHLVLDVCCFALVTCARHSQHCRWSTSASRRVWWVSHGWRAPELNPGWVHRRMNTFLGVRQAHFFQTQQESLFKRCVWSLSRAWPARTGARTHGPL